MKDKNFMIRKVYKCLRGLYDKVVWKSIICKNIGVLKVVFIIWVVLWNKLRIKDMVSK